MKKPSKYTGLTAGTAAIALLLTTSAFAESRHRRETAPSQGDERPAAVAPAPASQDSGTVDRRFQRNGSAEQRSSATDTRNGQAGNYGRGTADATRQDRGHWRGRNGTSGTDVRGNDSARGSYDRRSNDNNRGSYDSSRGRNDNRGTYDNNRGRNDNNRGSYDNRGRNDNRGGNNGSYDRGRNDNHIHTQGVIRSFTRERDGYRIYLDRGGYSYWIPSSRLRGHQLRVGLSLRLGGIFSNGLVNVDLLGWPGDPYYNDPYYYDTYSSGYGSGYGYGDSGYDNALVRGTVERVDIRAGIVLIRDDASRGRVVEVSLRSLDRRYSRLDVADLRPGDRVTISGAWLRSGYFDAARIDSIDAY